MVNVKTRLSNKNNYGKKRELSSIKWIVIHYTGNDGDTDESNGRYFEKNIVNASAHLFVDSDSITQSVPDNYIAWAVGGGRKSDKGGSLFGVVTNSNSISIELCDDVKNGTVYPSEKTIKNALELVRLYMKKYNIKADHVVRHFDVNGKICPAYWIDGNKWEKEFHSKLSEDSNPSSKIILMPKDSASEKIAVDGYWGKDTTKKAQKVFGTVQDGIVSNQPAKNMQFLPNAYINSWDFKSKGYEKGSMIIKAIQKKIGAETNGIFCTDSVKAFQKWLGVPSSGVMESKTVRVFQEWLNKQ